MNGVDSSREPENANTAGLSRAPAMPDRYDIAYGSGTERRGGEYRARAFKAIGAIEFTDARVRIDASAPRLFGPRIETKLQLAPPDIFNVVVNERLVGFEAASEDGRLRTVVLRARSRREAREIASRLPNTVTPAFAAEAAALENFLDGVETLTPRVWVTWAIIALNVLVYAIMVRTGGGFPKISLHSAIAFGSNFGPDTVNGEPWRLLTSMFVHLGFAHIVLNMLLLGYVGIIVERLYGNARFAALYLFAGLAASLTGLCLHYGLNSAGASGAIFGVLGALLAYVVRFWSTMPRTLHAKRFRTVASIIIYSLVNGLTHPGVDNAAHFGGLIAGFAMGWILARPADRSEPRPDPRRTGALACSLAAFVFAGLGWQAVRATSSPDGQKELAFAVMEEKTVPLEQKAVADLKTIAAMVRIPSRQAEVAAQIHTTVWPEWNALHETVSHAPLPAGSPRQPFRDAQLRYYDDMRQAMLVMADLATLHPNGDSSAARKLKALLEDAKRQRIAATRLALRQ
jgi:rhomboid protease GluP